MGAKLVSITIFLCLEAHGVQQRQKMLPGLHNNMNRHDVTKECMLTQTWKTYAMAKPTFQVSCPPLKKSKWSCSKR